MDGRMDKMLHAMHGDRRRRARDIQDALYAQQLFAVAVEQHGQPQAEQGPVERPVENEGESVDGLVVTIAIVRRLAMLTMPRSATTPVITSSRNAPWTSDTNRYIAVVTRALEPRLKK